uniref:Uncharacterized protein n=1 Tax=Entomoneis paludosa TaxID=265537 RepID=A0A7S3DM41_9STRA
MACRLVALDKCPGVRPVGIGESFRRLMAKCIVLVAGHSATIACGSSNLCAGLSAGIEGALHAMKEAPAHFKAKALKEWVEEPASSPGADATMDDGPAASSPTMGGAGADDTGFLSQAADVAAAGEAGRVTEADIWDHDPLVRLTLDARNGFNELSRKAMLWTVRHKWAVGAWFALNCYRHQAQLILRRKGRPCYTILSEEGVTQGDPLSMTLSP